MRYESLGETGIQVSRYCLGTLALGWTPSTPERSECIRIIRRAIEAGINFVDTADVYGESEAILGEALKGRRDDIVIATKVQYPMGDDPNMRGSSRRWITRAVEGSLRRLNTDWIDLYQLHRPDPETSFDETLSIMSDLVHQGKIRAIGTSTFPAEEIVEGQWIAARRGYERVTCEHAPYSVFARAIERSVLPTCQRFGMGVLCNSPLNRGWLSGIYRDLEDIDLTSGPAADNPRRFDPKLNDAKRKIELVAQLVKLSERAGIPLNHLAMGFVTAHAAVTAAVIGPSSMSDLEAYLSGFDVELEDTVLDEIDQIVPPGSLVSAVDAGYDPPSVTDATRRRRPLGRRSAA